MSLKLINHSPDLNRLCHEGYCTQIQGALLLLREIPYVNEQRQVKIGTLISPLNMAGDVTQYAGDHVAYFDGEFPCNADGTQIHQIVISSNHVDLGHGLTAKYTFSSKPVNG